MTQTQIVPVDDQGNEIVQGSRGQMAGFQGSAANVGELARHAGTAGTVAREEAEIKAAIVLARGNPRDELASYNRLIKSCQRAGFAEGALYRFPRGGKDVEGPSIDMAREAARVWGNIRFGLRIVTEDQGTVHIKGYAYDLEANNYVEAEDKFSKLIQRKDKSTGQTRWVQPDERDLRELVNRRGAICVRNAILQLLPPDIIDDAVQEVRKTIRAAAAGELKGDREATIRRLVLAFSQFQVTTEMIAAWLEHPLDLITDEELASLRTVFTSMRDGNSKREDHFDIPWSTKPDQGDAQPVGGTVAGIMNKLDQTKAATQEAPRSGEPAGGATSAPLTPQGAAEGQAKGAEGNGAAAGNAPAPQPAGGGGGMFGGEPPSTVGPKPRKR